MPRVLVIADDLSGATDVGAQFATREIAAHVVIWPSPVRSRAIAVRPQGNNSRARGGLLPGELSGLFRRFDVVIVDTESRHLSPAEARERVASVAREGCAAGVDVFYKKTDSTLRGNVGAELEGLLRASGQPTLCFVPAHPLLGRATRGGVQYVQGRLLHESAFAADPRNAIHESDVPAILARQSSLPVTVAHRAALRSLQRHPPSGVVVFDAETQADIRRITRAIQRAGCFRALAGAAAFALSLAKCLNFDRPADAGAQTESGDVSSRLRLQPASRRAHRAGTGVRPARKPRQGHVPLLVVNGSLNEVSLRQCAEARQHGFADLRLTPEVLVRRTGPESSAADRIVEQTLAYLRQGRDVVLSSVHRREECGAFERLATTAHLRPGQTHARIAQNTGRIVARILALRGSGGDGPAALRPRPSSVTVGRTRPQSLAGPPNLLAVFGGDTLMGIAHALGWRGFISRAEILPGLAASEVVDRPGLLVISKPGGFGDDDVLLQLARNPLLQAI